MRTYIIRRLLLMIPSIFIITVIVFGLVRMIPGNAVDQLFAEMASMGKSGLNREDIEHMLGLAAIMFTGWAGKPWAPLVPFGGREGRLGSNPLAMAFPHAEGAPGAA